jgi:Polyketide cyclase / dehydrase and lipid transport
MRAVQVAMTFPAGVEAAQACWYDVARWPAWVHGCERVVGVSGGWPGLGSVVNWESTPAGRGAVREEVLAYDERAGQQLRIRDDSIEGRQSVGFTAVDDGVAVTLTLEYTITKRSLITPVLDLLFVARAMSSSLSSTLTRFGAELAGRPQPGAGA